jgi:prefoldin subunit 5
MAEAKENKKPVRQIQMTPEIAKNIVKVSRQNLNRVMQRKVHVEQSLLSLDATLANIDALQNNTDEQGMINLGNGVFVSLKFPEKTKKALFQIGNDIMIDKEFPEIKTVLDSKKMNLQKEYELLVRQEAELTDNLNKLYFYLSSVEKKVKETKQ